MRTLLICDKGRRHVSRSANQLPFPRDQHDVTHTTRLRSLNSESRGKGSLITSEGYSPCLQRRSPRTSPSLLKQLLPLLLPRSARLRKDSYPQDHLARSNQLALPRNQQERQIPRRLQLRRPTSQHVHQERMVSPMIIMPCLHLHPVMLAHHLLLCPLQHPGRNDQS